jgi:hypothetical protein
MTAGLGCKTVRITPHIQTLMDRKHHVRTAVMQGDEYLVVKFIAYEMKARIQEHKHYRKEHLS